MKRIEHPLQRQEDECAVLQRNASAAQRQNVTHHAALEIDSRGKFQVVSLQEILDVAASFLMPLNTLGLSFSNAQNGLAKPQFPCIKYRRNPPIRPEVLIGKHSETPIRFPPPPQEESSTQPRSSRVGQRDSGWASQAQGPTRLTNFPLRSHRRASPCEGGLGAYPLLERIAEAGVCCFLPSAAVLGDACLPGLDCRYGLKSTSMLLRPNPELGRPFLILIATDRYQCFNLNS